MSDSSGITKPSDIRPVQSPMANGRGESTTAARLLNAPEVTKGREDRYIHIKGEVIAHSKDGKLSIRTQSGDIEVQLPPDNAQKAPLKLIKGQSVEVEIPPEKARARINEAISIKVKEARPQATEQQSQAQQSGAGQDAAKNQNAGKADGATPAASTSGATQTQPQQTQVQHNQQSGTPPQQSAPKITTPVYIPPEQASQILKDTAPAPPHTDPALLVQKLQGAPIRIDPLPTGDLSQILQPYPAISLQSALPAQVQNLATTIPLQIENAQQNMMMQTSAAHAASNISIQNQYDRGIFESANLANSTSIHATSQDSKAAPIFSQIHDTMNLGQPLDIKSVFFLKPITAQLQTDGTFLPASTAIPESNNAGLIARQNPFTASIERLQLPDVILRPAAIAAPSITGAGADPVLDIESQIQRASWPQAEPAFSGDTQNRFAFSTEPPILGQSKIGSLQAIVQGTNAANLPVIAFPSLGGAENQSFLLQLPLDKLPAGTILELMPQTIQGSASLSALSGQNAGAHTLQGVQQALSSLPQPAYFLTPENWPVMQELMQSVAAAQAAASASIAGKPSALLPNAANPAQFGAAALFVLAALKSGDFSQIINDRAQDSIRRAGKGGLLSRLTEEGAIINRTNAGSASQDWRALTLPMQWGQDVQKIALYYKGERGEDAEESKGGKHTRFIFDLNLSRMGKVQLDGLFRGDRLDLILRTQELFSRAMQIQLKTSYAEAIGATGLQGDISFQNDPQSWVTVKVKTADGLMAQI